MLLCPEMVHNWPMSLRRQKGAVQVSGQDHVIGLADAIDALRSELAEAIARGAGQPMRFQVEPIELAVQAVITKDAGGRIGWGALGVGASYQSATTQTLTLKLKPMWQASDGTLTADPLIADQTTERQEFGSA